MGLRSDLNPQLPLPERATLLRELNHRINNEFASAISAVCLATARCSHAYVSDRREFGQLKVRTIGRLGRPNHVVAF